jgi:hypothetical protein
MKAFVLEVIVFQNVKKSYQKAMEAKEMNHSQKDCSGCYVQEKSQHRHRLMHVVK